MSRSCDRAIDGGQGGAGRSYDGGMTRDVYGRPPRPLPPEEAGITRRSLLRLPLTRTARLDVDFEAITDRVRGARERTSNDGLLRAIEPVAGLIAEVAGVEPGTRVLDACAGDGNVALACSAHGAEVTACDLAPRMVERGRDRCGDSVEWVIADAASLPFADRVFDATLSAFGFARGPEPLRAAHELCRVTRPGGVVVLAAWVPRGLPGGLYELAERVVPLPDGVPSPADWGRQDVVSRRLAPLLEALELRTRTIRLSYADRDAAFDALSTATALEPTQLQALRHDFERLLASCNNSVEAVEIDARYLIAVGRRPA
jgi:SAM-dependent methyltransferase